MALRPRNFLAAIALPRTIIRRRVSRRARPMSTARQAVTAIKAGNAGLRHFGGNFGGSRRCDGGLHSRRAVLYPPMPSPRRVDVLQNLYKRRQINRPQYLAARSFRKLLASGPADRLKDVEGALAYSAGGDGVELVRAILSGTSIEQAARANGASTRREVHCWSWLFRRGLDVLTVRFGYRPHSALAGPMQLNVMAGATAQHARQLAGKAAMAAARADDFE
jgi:hypothetical protein